jgi:hypothetical protein
MSFSEGRTEEMPSWIRKIRFEGVHCYKKVKEFLWGAKQWRGDAIIDQGDPVLKDLTLLKNNEKNKCRGDAILDEEDTVLWSALSKKTEEIKVLLRVQNKGGDAVLDQNRSVLRSAQLKKNTE